MPVCSHCGKEVSEGIKFCPECGERLKKEFTPEETEKYIRELDASVEEEKPAKKTKTTKKQLTVAIVGCIIGVIAIIAAVVICTPEGVVPASRRPAVATFVEEWNTFAQDAFPHLNLNIPIKELVPVADGDWATTYFYRFWEGATKDEYHRFEIVFAKEGSPLQRSGTIAVSVVSNRYYDAERIIASWGLLIATMLPDGRLEDTGDILRELEAIDTDADIYDHFKEITKSGIVFGFDGFGQTLTLYADQL